MSLICYPVLAEASRRIVAIVIAGQQRAGQPSRRGPRSLRPQQGGRPLRDSRARAEAGERAAPARLGVPEAFRQVDAVGFERVEQDGAAEAGALGARQSADAGLFDAAHLERPGERPGVALATARAARRRLVEHQFEGARESGDDAFVLGVCPIEGARVAYQALQPLAALFTGECYGANVPSMRADLSSLTTLPDRRGVGPLLASLLLWGCSSPDHTIAEPNQTVADSGQAVAAQKLDRVREHLAWMEGCSDGAVEFRRIDDLDIYAAAISRTDPDEVVSCLLSIGPDAAVPATIVGTPESLGIIVRTPFYTIRRPVTREEPPGFVYERVPGHAALIRTPSVVYVVQQNGEHVVTGVVALRHVRDDLFLFLSDFISGGTYLFRASVGDARYLSDGTVKVEDSRDLVFRVKRATSFWEPFEFRYDALIDQDGNILDIPAPGARTHTGFEIVCMRSDIFVARSTLDISRLNRKKVCVEQ